MRYLLLLLMLKHFRLIQLCGYLPEPFSSSLLWSEELSVQLPLLMLCSRISYQLRLLSVTDPDYTEIFR